MKSDITMLIPNKDDIKFVTEFPCLLGHPVYVYYDVLWFICRTHKIGSDIRLELIILYNRTYNYSYNSYMFSCSRESTIFKIIIQH